MSSPLCKRKSGFAPFVAMALCLSCRVYVPRDDFAPSMPVPETFSEQGTPGFIPDAWWTEFGDPNLNGLVEEGLLENLDLAAAWARIGQFQALARQAGAGAWPSLDLTAGVSRSRSIAGGQASTDNLFAFGIPASYEVDLWRRISSQTEAARLEVEASRQDLEAAAITVSAAIVETWLAIQENGLRLQLLRDQIETGETYLELVELRYALGQASGVDVLQQRQQLAGTEAQVPLVHLEREAYFHALAVLLSRPPLLPPDLERPELPNLPEMPEIGIPMDLLTNRPDLEAARIRLAAADRQIGAAVANRYPALRLSGTGNYRGETVGSAFDNWLWSLAANLTQPVLDGGRRAAEVDRTQAVLAERLHAYSQKTLTAIREVEDALSRERHQSDYLLGLRKQIAISVKTLEESRSRYSTGLSDYLPVLTALQSLQQLQRTELSARKQLLTYRVQLYRALGGAPLSRVWQTTYDPSR